MRSRATWKGALVALSLGSGAVLLAGEARANHPVLVEGNCLVPPAGSSTVIVAGTCGDYDGDGLIGSAEDGDGDRVFGSIGAALGGGTGANQNGRVVIVTSGTFAEVVSITGANGNVQLEAAPGVEANVDAVLQGDPGSGGRQAAPGIVVDAPADRHVIIRNVVSRNWATGILVRGASRVLIEGARVDNNVNWGILVRDDARVTIDGSSVDATGHRVGGGLDFPRVAAPAPGVGIEFQDASSGLVRDTCVTGSFAAGIKNSAGKKKDVDLEDVCLFDNAPDLEGFGGKGGH
jgi:hypothetical protein